MNLITTRCIFDNFLELVEFTDEFTKSLNVENQLKLLKTLKVSEMPAPEREEFIKFFCELYLSCSVKHPVRNTLSKLVLTLIDPSI